jgi:hypothetical protein
MTPRLVLLIDSDLDDDKVQGCQEWCTALSDFAQTPVQFAVVNQRWLDDTRTALEQGGGVQITEVVEPRPPVSAAPMSSAPFVWREDGRPDWEAMWTGFCDLALYGGPPHRGEDTALHAPDPDQVRWSDDIATAEMIAEIRRGIYETTGLYAEPAEEPGWIAIHCHSRKMAAWLAACVILENVDARCEDEVLYVPASPDFDLKNEVKSVITVVAKTNHYWQAHIEEQEAKAAALA